MVKATADEFIDHFRTKPRAIIVSAQMLLEGFDDPDINTVVITYPSSSMILLMQAAGRCVRYTPQKTKAYVLQTRNDAIAYHLDQRWLYQEISDYLHPQLLDIEYTDLNDLRTKFNDVLVNHRISDPHRNKSLSQVNSMALGDRCRLLLIGLPYYGSPDTFLAQAQWSCVFETQHSSAVFRELFNSFSALGADLSDPTEFLRKLGGQ